MKNLQKESSSRRENSEKCLSDIEAKQKESEDDTTTSKQRISSYLTREQEAAHNNLMSLNSKLNRINRDQKEFEDQSVKEIDNFKAFATNLIDELKKVCELEVQVIFEHDFCKVIFLYIVSQSNIIFFIITGCTIRNYSP